MTQLVMLPSQSGGQQPYPDQGWNQGSQYQQIQYQNQFNQPWNQGSQYQQTQPQNQFNQAQFQQSQFQNQNQFQQNQPYQPSYPQQQMSRKPDSCCGLY